MLRVGPASYGQSTLNIFKINELAPNIFYTLVELERLDLSNNQIKELNENSFKELVKLVFQNDSLKKLDLSSNNILSFDFQGTHLEYLRLNNNKICQIKMAKTPNLKALYLHENLLENIVDLEISKIIQIFTAYNCKLIRAIGKNYFHASLLSQLEDSPTPPLASLTESFASFLLALKRIDESVNFDLKKCRSEKNIPDIKKTYLTNKLKLQYESKEVKNTKIINISIGCYFKLKLANKMQQFEHYANLQELDYKNKETTTRKIDDLLSETRAVFINCYR